MPLRESENSHQLALLKHGHNGTNLSCREPGNLGSWPVREPKGRWRNLYKAVMVLLVWSQVSSVSSWKNSWTWSGRNQDKLEVARTSDFYLPSSHPNNLQSIMTVTSFLLSITHTIFSLDNLYHLSTDSKKQSSSVQISTF